LSLHQIVQNNVSFHSRRNREGHAQDTQHPCHWMLSWFFLYVVRFCWAKLNKFTYYIYQWLSQFLKNVYRLDFRWRLTYAKLKPLINIFDLIRICDRRKILFSEFTYFYKTTFEHICWCFSSKYRELYFIEFLNVIRQV